ncbi:MAG: Fic family protein [Egibacteraceae bacterium]
MNESVFHHWQSIEDLTADDHLLASPELAALNQVWNEQRSRLIEVNALQAFNERLRRQWAIETGIIEHLYSLDRGVTETLIEHGVSASLIPHSAADRDPELIVRMIHDHEEAIDWTFDFVKGDRQLSTAFIKELHALMTRHQDTAAGVDQFGKKITTPLLRGAFKTWPNNPTREDGGIHEYCPPEQVDSEMDRLVELHRKHLAEHVAPEVEAAWLHHRFTQIHPFQDGNGRVVRALASLVLIRVGWFPLVITRDDRQRYIQSLERADVRDLRPLVNLVAALQRRAFVQALSAVGTAIAQTERLDQVIHSIREEFAAKEKPPGQDEVKQMADVVLGDARERMESLAGRLDEELGAVLSPVKFFVNWADDTDHRRDWHRFQIIRTARALDYFANTRDYAAWCRLVLQADSRAEILLSLHGVGQQFRGIIAASLSFFRREELEDGTRQVTDITPVVDEVFQMNYREGEQSVRERFGDWLETGLLHALQMWRRGL